MPLPGEGWQVEKRRTKCCQCETEFPPGRSFFSVLLEQDGELKRSDFCGECWESESNEDYFCFWKSRRPESNEQQTVGPAVLLDLLEQLRHPSSEYEKALRLVLALYLARKKVLVLDTESLEDDPLVFETDDGEDRYRVEQVNLSEEQAQELTEKLEELLSVDL